MIKKLIRKLCLKWRRWRKLPASAVVTASDAVRRSLTIDIHSVMEEEIRIFGIKAGVPSEEITAYLGYDKASIMGRIRKKVMQMMNDNIIHIEIDRHG